MIFQKIKIKIPRVPNFLLGENNYSFPVKHFTEKQLRQIGKEWTQDLIKRAKQQRINWGSN